MCRWERGSVAKAPGGKPAPASPGAATRGRPGSEGTTPLRLPAPSSPSPFPRRRAGAAPLAPRPPGPTRPASPQAAGARPRGPARELCREEKLGSQSGGQESGARGGGAALRWARGAAGARRRVQAAPGRRLPRAAGRPGRGRPPRCSSGRSSPSPLARGSSLGRGAGRATLTREPMALPPPARPRGGTFLAGSKFRVRGGWGAVGAAGLRYRRGIISEPPQT